MPDHYYTQNPQSAHKPAKLIYEYRGHTLVLDTDSGVFSRDAVDFGTALLLDTLPDELTGDVLDMGCGYGVIGVCVGKHFPDTHVIMSDVNERACELARINAEKNGVSARVCAGDGYASLSDEHFDCILQNPPIRAGKAVIYTMFAEGAARLKNGGALWLVIRKQQGAPSAMTYLKTLFGNVEAVEKKAGYWIIRCDEPVQNK